MPAGALGQAASSNSSPKPKRSIAERPDWPKADASDVSTIQNTVRALFSSFSASSGGKLNRLRLRSLFVPDGRIASAVAPEPGHPADVVFMTPDQYADLSDAATRKSGFFDKNIANHIQTFGVMAHVYATYESRASPEDKTPMARGIKSIDLLKSGGRWYILQVYWDTERPDNPIPKRYLRDELEDTAR